jgi:hypothetical protein
LAAFGAAFLAAALSGDACRAATDFFTTICRDPFTSVSLFANRAGNGKSAPDPRQRGTLPGRPGHPVGGLGRQACIRCAQLTARYSGTWP